jgi:hypothetical protein
MKDREKVLKEELPKLFEGHSQRLTMLSKLILGIVQLGTISYSKLSLVINPKFRNSQTLNAYSVL